MPTGAYSSKNTLHPHRASSALMMAGQKLLGLAHEGVHLHFHLSQRSPELARRKNQNFLFAFATPFRWWEPQRRTSWQGVSCAQGFSFHTESTPAASTGYSTTGIFIHLLCFHRFPLHPPGPSTDQLYTHRSTSLSFKGPRSRIHQLSHAW